MSRYFRSEWLKEKRTGIRRLFWGLPIVFALFSLGLSSLMVGNEGAPYFMAVSYNWFPLFFMPLVIALISSQQITLEETSRGGEQLLSLGLQQWSLFFSKYLVASVSIGVILGINGMITWGLEFFWLHEAVSYPMMMATSLGSWLCYQPLILLSSFIRLKSHTLFCLAANFVLAFAGVLFATKSWWWLFPWSYVARLTASLLAIHPNGVLLALTDGLVNPQYAWIAIGMSMLLTLILLFLAHASFKRKEEV